MVIPVRFVCARTDINVSNVLLFKTSAILNQTSY
jgi:hypothetical protein